MKWIWGGSLFVAGWMLLFLGHKVEGNHPAFFQGPIYLLVGPIWVAKEAWNFLIGTHPPAAVGRAENGTAPGRVNKRDKYGIKRREMVEFGKDRADDWSSDRKAINFRHDHKGSILETPAKRSNVWI